MAHGIFILKAYLIAIHSILDAIMFGIFLKISYGFEWSALEVLCGISDMKKGVKPGVDGV